MIALAQSVSPWQPLPLLPARALSPSSPSSFPSSRLFPSLSLPATVTRNRTCRSSGSNDPKLKEEASFFDENGVVKDMDGYLNYLSLEYDSVWDTKPSWCQPWTITLTGVLIVTSSWLLLHSTIVTAVVLTLVCAWWYIFLYSYPKCPFAGSVTSYALIAESVGHIPARIAYIDMIAERRKKVTSGLEDTYGVKTKQ